MTLRKLPPEGSSLDFTADILAGRRPDFLPEVMLIRFIMLLLSLYLDSRMLTIHFLWLSVCKAVGSKATQSDQLPK